MVKALLEVDYEAISQKLSDIEAEAREADELHLRMQRAVKAKHGDKFNQQLGGIETDRQQARSTMIQLRHVVNYRRALQKVGLKPEDVARRFVKRIPRRYAMFKVFPSRLVVYEVETKDGRRVPVEPSDVPGAMAKDYRE